MKRKLVVNPDEPKTGDDGFTFYDNAHPISGKAPVINRLRKELKGLRGATVTVTVRGQRQDNATGVSRAWTARRTVELTSYSDLFGPGSVYLSALKGQMKRDSDSKLVVQNIIIEDNTGEDDEDEE